MSVNLCIILMYFCMFLIGIILKKLYNLNFSYSAMIYYLVLKSSTYVIITDITTIFFG